MSITFRSFDAPVGPALVIKFPEQHFQAVALMLSRNLKCTWRTVCLS